MSGATITLGESTFEEKVKSGGIVLVDWWAPWCGPCRMFGPIFEKAAGAHADITFAKINTDEEQRLASAFEIRSIPTLMAFRDGILVFSEAGALPGPALEELIKAVQALDMDDVRKKVAEQQG